MRKILLFLSLVLIVSACEVVKTEEKDEREVFAVYTFSHPVEEILVEQETGQRMHLYSNGALTRVYEGKRFESAPSRMRWDNAVPNSLQFLTFGQDYTLIDVEVGYIQIDVYVGDIYHSTHKVDLHPSLSYAVKFN